MINNTEHFDLGVYKYYGARSNGGRRAKPELHSRSPDLYNMGRSGARIFQLAFVLFLTLQTPASAAKMATLSLSLSHNPRLLHILLALLIADVPLLPFVDAVVFDNLL